MFFGEYYEIFKKAYFEENLWTLLLNNVKRNYPSMKIVKLVLNVSQHSQENTFTGVSFLINIVVACNLSLSLFKKRFRHWCFPDSYLKFLTTTFLKREKKHCHEKRSIVIRNPEMETWLRSLRDISCRLGTLIFSFSKLLK